MSNDVITRCTITAEDNTSGFFINTFIDQNYYPPHTHEFIELQYILSGKGIHYINGDQYSVVRGNMLFLNYNDIHSQKPETPMEIITCHMTQSFFSEEIINAENALDVLTLSCFQEFTGITLGIPPITMFEGKEMMEIEMLIHMMIEEYNGKQKGFTTALKGYINVLFTRMLRKASNSYTHEFPHVVHTVLQFIEANYNQKLYLAELAKRCFYNTNYLGRIFKECYGESISSYIQRYRIDKAAQMLINSQNTVESICMQVGYNDKKQFYKIFKSYFGLTPNQYRLKHAFVK